MGSLERCISVLFGLVLLMGLTNSLTFANYRNNPDPLPGFTHSPLFADDSPKGNGKILSGGVVVRSSPVIAEINGNSGDGKEVAIAGADGWLYVYKSNGSLLWQKYVLPGACSVPAGDSLINSTPAVGELFGNGVPYVVIGYGTIQPSNCDGGVVAYRGSDGAEGWRYGLAAVSPNEQLHGVVSSPSLADTDGDGRLQVGFGGLDREVYLLNADGTLRWRYHAADTVWSSPAFADINGDSRPEMIIATDITGNPAWGTTNGGYVHAFATQPRTPQEIPFGTGYIWRDWFDQAIYSSPAIGDVLPDNPGPEIVIGSGIYYPGGGKWIRILRPNDGSVLRTLNTSACSRSSPALGDIDDDGKLEIVVTITGSSSCGGDGFSHVVAWDPDAAAQKWSFTPMDANGTAYPNDPHGDDLQSPVIADLDGNGSLEVIVANQWTVHVVSGKTGQPLTCQNPSCGSQLSLYAWWTVKSTPAVGDLNGDGRLEVVIGASHSYNRSHGMLYVWTDLARAGLGSATGTQPIYSAPWPMFRHDARHTGSAQSLRLAVVPRSIYLMHQLGDSKSEQMTMTIQADGGGSMAWTMAVPQGVTANPSSGTTSTSALATITISTAGRSLGTHAIGNLSVTATSGSNPVPGSPASIPLTLHIVQQLHRTLLPGIVR